MCNKGCKYLISFGFLVCFFMAGSIPYLSAMEGELVSNDQNRKGWGTISGRLAWVEMDNLSDTEWKEFALIEDEGKVTILIGKVVEQLLEKAGSPATVTGVYKASMRMKGEVTPVLEVRFIDKI